MNFCRVAKPTVGAQTRNEFGSGEVLNLYEENWRQSLPGTPSPIGHAYRAFSDFSSTLSSEAPVSGVSGVFTTSPTDIPVAGLHLRKVNKIEHLAATRDAIPAFGATGNFDSLSSPSITKPVPIPYKRGGPSSDSFLERELADLHNSNVAPIRINEDEQGPALAADVVLGSWTQRKIVYLVKTQAAPAHSPDSVLASYGFIPPELAAKAAQPPPPPAFWPQSGGCSKGPHKAAMEEAARAATVKPTQHVVFKAACKVEAPQRPGVARPLPALVGRRRLPAVPAKKEGPELNTEERLWRLQSKRAWIREQLRALRGFPKDSAYDEPWSDAFDMVQAMGDGLNLQTRAPLDFSDSDEDGFSSDSDLHERLLFEEEPASKQGSAKTSDLATGTLAVSETPDINITLPAEAATKTSALSTGSKSASGLSTASTNQPTTVVGCAQELIRRQRTIELDAQRTWQGKFSARKAASPGAAADGKAATANERLLFRNDSAYEGPKKAHSRAAIKQAPPQAAEKTGDAKWAGALLPAAEFDTDGAVTYALIRVTDDRSGASRVLLRGKSGQSEAQIVEAVEEHAARVARLNNLGQVTVELVRGGTMHWGDAEGGAPPKVSAPALEVIW